MATKSKIKADYIANLKATYAFYVEGSSPLELANLAADKALAGIMRLEGDCWFNALASNGLPKNITLKALAALED